MDILSKLQQELSKHNNVFDNASRKVLIEHAIQYREAIVSASGSLATWTTKDSTGRSPKDTYVVKRTESMENIDWNSPNNHAMEPEIFASLFDDAINLISSKERMYITNRVVGTQTKYALPVRVITSRAIAALFTDNMFPKVPKNIKESVFSNKEFTLFVLPYDKIDLKKYIDIDLRDMAIVMDMDKKLGLIIGSAYNGSIKKMIFTVMNYLLPEEGVLPLHCGANEDKEGNTALFLGLSGTGKTSLATDPQRKLIGDDEHLWSNDGIANFESGCYAKLINLNPKKEPEIYNAVFTNRHHLEDGTIIENAMIYPDGYIDLDDERLSQNSRVSYPIEYLSNVNLQGSGGHPKTIIFLTADANGVLPPVAKLNTEQAMFWFLMGYTSKLAGTETGVLEPTTVFSRFFGEPFMPRNPNDYAELLGEKIKKYNTKVFLVNTGWTGGPYGVGERIDISISRKIIDNILSNKLDNVEYQKDERFKFFVPKTCDGIDSKILNPEESNTDKNVFNKRADTLAQEFYGHFTKMYVDKVDRDIKDQCPKKLNEVFV
ncbi:phosphoenolpyruvate carboxykinase (ATP) [Patescibacteria group bacterium]|nr:phosphoenolpyruvate carboxykinase (ATP) [Patescibacteria group bacterium]